MYPRKVVALKVTFIKAKETLDVDEDPLQSEINFGKLILT